MGFRQQEVRVSAPACTVTCRCSAVIRAVVISSTHYSTLQKRKLRL